MKIQVLNQEGKKVKEIESGIFSEKVREDIVQKVFEAQKQKQPYAPSESAGEGSAPGKLKHVRRAWMTVTGYGISRVSRKIMWRRGSRFYWQAATAPQAVKGRRAHPPKIESMQKIKKINKKEERLAFKIAIASTSLKEWLKKRYSSLEKVNELPIVVESGILKLKTKEFFSALKKILGNIYTIAVQKKTIRAGKGKRRGRKYKKNAGMLLVLGNEENKKIKGIEIKKVKELSVSELFPLGRLVVYTEVAVKDLEKKLNRREK